MPATCDRCGGIHETYRFALERGGVPAGHIDQPWDDSQTCEWDSGVALDAAVERLANDGRHTVGTRIPLGDGTAITDQGDEVDWNDDQPLDGIIVLA